MGALLLKVLPGRAGGKSSDQKVLKKHKVVQVLKERQVHKEQKMIQVLTEIQVLREHKVRAGGPAAATGGDGSPRGATAAQGTGPADTETLLELQAMVSCKCCCVRCLVSWSE